jgi:hypothetical protein
MKWLVAALFPVTLAAHMVSLSTGEVHVEGAYARYELRMPTYEVAHVRDPERTLLDNIHFRSAGVEGRANQKQCRADNGAYVCAAVYEFPAPVETLEAECTFAAVTVPNHVHVLHAYRGDKSDQAVFDVSYTIAELRFRPPTPWEIAAREAGAGFVSAIGGVAPLLFLAALALAARSRRELLALTAAFLVGEVAASALAGRLALSPRFLEAAAALTIAYLAFEILLLPRSGQRWAVVCALGLFHGAYFSMFLASSGYAALNFLSGVIAAQLLTIAVLALALFKITKTARVVPALASALLAVGLIWFFVRLAGA